MSGALLRDAIIERLRESLWVWPAVSIVAATTLGLALGRLAPDVPLMDTEAMFAGGVDTARDVLTTIAAVTITVTGTLFSITVIALQLASTQYSPRLLRNFLRDRGTQLTLSVFLATFSYTLAVLSTLPADDGEVPRLAITVLYVLVAAVVAMLVYFIHHVTQSIRVETIVDRVFRDTLTLIDDLHPPGGSAEDIEAPTPPSDSHRVRALTSGHLQEVDLARLRTLALQRGAVIRLNTQPGDYIVDGEVVAFAWPCGDDQVDTDDLDKLVAGSLQTGRERTMQQDVAFGVRQLVDIAVKALSPSLNDPTTAVQVIGPLTAICARLAERPLGTAVLADHEGRDRVWLPCPSFAAFLTLATGQIRRFGAREPAVMRRLLELLTTVAGRVTTTERRDAVRRAIEDALTEAEASIHQPADLAVVRGQAAAATSVLDGGQTPPEQTVAG